MGVKEKINIAGSKKLNVSEKISIFLYNFYWILQYKFNTIRRWQTLRVIPMHDGRNTRS